MSPGVPGSDRHPLEVGTLEDREYCLLPPAVLAGRDLAVGHQVRLGREEHCALFTVVGSDEAVVVSEAGRDRLGTEGPVWIDSTVETATNGPVAGSFEEAVADGGDHLLACAPHGGQMEEWTDKQAERLAAALGGTAWVCLGRWPNWEAFHRWHVTSNDLHPASFPKLDAIADRGFDRAVSFHAWRKAGVGVGGAAPRDLRVAVRDAIDAVVGEDHPVTLATDARYRGDSPENVVNWLTADGTSGIQIEQGRAVREDHSDDIAEAVAAVLRDRSD